MIKVVAFKGVGEGILEILEKGLEKYFRKVQIEESRPAVPYRSYSPIRHQHNSVPFMEDIGKFSNSGEIVLGITSKDLYYNNLNFIFGHAHVGGKAAIISVNRLDPVFYGKPENKELFQERVLKEAIHEIGHCIGLPHCDNPSCVMVFSSSILGVDRKGHDFCRVCIGKLSLR